MDSNGTFFDSDFQFLLQLQTSETRNDYSLIALAPGVSSEYFTNNFFGRVHLLFVLLEKSNRSRVFDSQLRQRPQRRKRQILN